MSFIIENTCKIINKTWLFMKNNLYYNKKFIINE
jgi:hypothetical protein